MLLNAEHINMLGVSFVGRAYKYAGLLKAEHYILCIKYACHCNAEHINMLGLQKPSIKMLGSILPTASIYMFLQMR